MSASGNDLIDALPPLIQGASFALPERRREPEALYALEGEVYRQLTHCGRRGGA
jgi:hypothetical protein